MLIDLHNHTRTHSSCSLLYPKHLIKQAKEKGLDGVVITDHNYLWTTAEQKALLEWVDHEITVRGMRVFFGQEVGTSAGHVVVIGYPATLPADISAQDLINRVEKAGAVAILAHPFRYGAKLKDETKTAENFRVFDSIEIYNYNLSSEERERGLAFCRKHNISAVGGSDAHSVDMIGQCFTNFLDLVETEKDLVEAIKKKRVLPVCQLKQKGYDPKEIIVNTSLESFRECKAVLFDIYGTLVDIHTEENSKSFQKLADWLSDNEIKIKTRDLENSYWQKTKEKYWENKRRFPYPDINVYDVFKEILEETTKQITSDELIKEACCVFRKATVGYIKLYQGVTDTLSYLKEKKFKLGIISNAQRSFTLPELEELGIADFFDEIIISSDISCGKPDALIFNKMLEKLGIRPQEAVYVGNDLFYDVYGAEKAGLKTVFVNTNIKSSSFSSVPDISLVNGDISLLKKIV